MASFDRTLFPNLLENCSEGLVNNIIFTGTETHPNHVRCGGRCLFVLLIMCVHHYHVQVSEVERLMRCCNSHASFIIAPKGVITRSDRKNLLS